MGKRVYLGLGSNLGNKERIVRKAIDKVGERVGAVVAVSSFYKTAPWGYQSVHTFCNAAIACRPKLDSYYQQPIYLPKRYYSPYRKSSGNWVVKNIGKEMAAMSTGLSI